MLQLYPLLPMGPSLASAALDQDFCGGGRGLLSWEVKWGAAASVGGRPFGLMGSRLALCSPCQHYPCCCPHLLDGPAFTVSALPFAAVHTALFLGLSWDSFSLFSKHNSAVWSLGCIGRE